MLVYVILMNVPMICTLLCIATLVLRHTTTIKSASTLGPTHTKGATTPATHKASPTWLWRIVGIQRGMWQPPSGLLHLDSC